MKSCNEVFKIQ